MIGACLAFSALHFSKLVQTSLGIEEGIITSVDRYYDCHNSYTAFLLAVTKLGSQIILKVGPFLTWN